MISIPLFIRFCFTTLSRFTVSAMNDYGDGLIILAISLLLSAADCMTYIVILLLFLKIAKAAQGGLL